MTTLEELLPSILEKTRQEKLKWEEAGNYAYIANLANFVIHVVYDQESTYIDHRLHLYNSAGQPLESLAPNRGTDVAKALAGIYELVRRKVLKIDEALDQVKDALNGL